QFSLLVVVNAFVGAMVGMERTILPAIAETDFQLAAKTAVLSFIIVFGVSQGLTWSTTVIMKIDLAGSERRGLAMGLNEFAGYLAVAISALATGWIAARWHL